MSLGPITLHAGDATDVEAVLIERIIEFNARATGYFDAEAFSATQRDEGGVIRAGICGHTWGGCCYVSYLWIDERERGRGRGSALLLAAEEHARTKHCVVMLLSSHSFQAPGFYERHGYERQAIIHDHPVGYTSVFLAKRLRTV
jgi:GNAT superfamily N-acetyltransferase